VLGLSFLSGTILAMARKPKKIRDEKSVPKLKVSPLKIFSRILVLVGKPLYLIFLLFPTLAIRIIGTIKSIHGKKLKAKHKKVIYQKTFLTKLKFSEFKPFNIKLPRLKLPEIKLPQLIFPELKSVKIETLKINLFELKILSKFKKFWLKTSDKKFKLKFKLSLRLIIIIFFSILGK